VPLEVLRGDLRGARVFLEALCGAGFHVQGSFLRSFVGMQSQKVSFLRPYSE
jgi:hypothetical protein